jgi:heme-degrading monooxygenase HmoA
MILELGVLEAKPGCAERVVELGREIARHRSRPENRAPGWRSYRLLRGVEDPNRFVLHIVWDSVDDRMNARSSEFNVRMRAALEPLLASGVGGHYELVDGCAVEPVEL